MKIKRATPPTASQKPAPWPVRGEKLLVEPAAAGPYVALASEPELELEPVSSETSPPAKMFEPIPATDQTSGSPWGRRPRGTICPMMTFSVYGGVPPEPQGWPWTSISVPGLDEIEASEVSRRP